MQVTDDGYVSTKATALMLKVTQMSYFSRYCMRSRQNYDKIMQTYAEVLNEFRYDYTLDEYDERVVSEMDTTTWHVFMITLHEVITLLEAPETVGFGTVKANKELASINDTHFDKYLIGKLSG